MKNSKNCPLRPIGPKVIVKLLFDQRDLMASTVLHIPEETKKEYVAACQRGEIIEIGPDAFDGWHEDNNLKIGDIVLIKKYSGTNRQYGKDVFRAVEDRDIWGVEDQKVIERLLNE